MIAGMLHQAGYRARFVISPYLEHFTERIRVNLRNSGDDLANLVQLIKEKIDGMVEDGFNHPTELR